MREAGGPRLHTTIQPEPLRIIHGGGAKEGRSGELHRLPTMKRLPPIIFNQMGGGEDFTKLDLHSGYHQMQDKVTSNAYLMLIDKSNRAAIE